MPYGVRPKTANLVKRIAASKGTAKKIRSIEKAVARLDKAKTVRAKGAMKPKIQNYLQSPTKMVKMSFEGSWNALCGATQLSVPYVFNLNSVNDPDFSNFTRNVRANGWAIANTLYTDYRVHKVKVTLEFINRSEFPCMMLLSANNDPSIQPASTYPTDLLARAGTFGKLLTREGGSKDYGKITKTYNLWEVEGISYDEYKDSAGTAALLTSNPTDNCYCYATIASYPEGFGNATFGVFRIKMEFDVELLNPRDQVATAV